jgi:hypothetical protein
MRHCHMMQSSDLHDGRLDRFDREMLTFFVRWAPYGGPPAQEVFPEFGISAECLQGRLWALVNLRGDSLVSPRDRALLATVRRILVGGNAIEDSEVECNG